MGTLGGYWLQRVLGVEESAPGSRVGGSGLGYSECSTNENSNNDLKSITVNHSTIKREYQ